MADSRQITNIYTHQKSTQRSISNAYKMLITMHLNDFLIILLQFVLEVSL